jgi:glycosyltransferase involved in cell wall biosynthesis
MKVLLLGNYLPDRQESMQRFSNVMEQELSQAGHVVRLVRPTEKLGKFSWPKHFVKWIGYVDKFLLFPLTLRSAVAWADVVHICDHSNSMYVKYVSEKPHLITCHDLLAVRSARGEFPENPVGIAGRLLQSWISRGLKLAQFIVCDSYATLNDCRHVLDIPSDQMSVVYLGLNYPYTPMPIDEAKVKLNQLNIANGQRYLVNVGNNSWYKNRLSVLKIFAHLVNNHKRDLNIIFAGRKLTPEMNAFIVDAGIENRVRQLGMISNEDLRALYSCAEGLIFPSLEEGFGWPVLEAQASGCPVFASNRPPMTEIGGDAAVYIDPLLPEDAAEVINAHLDALQDMRSSGMLNAGKFSNVAMRDAYLGIYSRIAQNQ